MRLGLLRVVIWVDWLVWHLGVCIFKFGYTGDGNN